MNSFFVDHGPRGSFLIFLVCFQGECSDQNLNLLFCSMLDSWEFIAVG